MKPDVVRLLGPQWRISAPYRQNQAEQRALRRACGVAGGPPQPTSSPSAVCAGCAAQALADRRVACLWDGVRERLGWRFLGALQPRVSGCCLPPDPTHPNRAP